MQPRSTRLNGDNRNDFIRRVMQDKLPENRCPQDERFYKKWQPKIYSEVYGPYEEHMDQLPSWFFVSSKTMQVRLATNPEESQFDTVSFEFDKEIKRINEQTGYYSYSKDTNRIPDLPYDHEASRDWRALRQAQRDFRTQQTELRQQLNQLVRTCNTSGQLYKAWSEAVNYSDCFPYKAPTRHQGSEVSEKEMEIGIKIAQTTSKLPDGL